MEQFVKIQKFKNLMLVLRSSAADRINYHKITKHQPIVLNCLNRADNNDNVSSNEISSIFLVSDISNTN